MPEAQVKIKDWKNVVQSSDSFLAKNDSEWMKFMIGSKIELTQTFSQRYHYHFLKTFVVLCEMSLICQNFYKSIETFKRKQTFWGSFHINVVDRFPTKLILTKLK